MAFFYVTFLKKVFGIFVASYVETAHAQISRGLSCAAREQGELLLPAAGFSGRSLPLTELTFQASQLHVKPSDCLLRLHGCLWSTWQTAVRGSRWS